MKKIIIVTGLTLVALLSASVGAYATSSMQEIKAFLSHTTKIKLDNGIIQANLSQPIDTILYKGSIFIPIKTVGNYTDASAIWNSQDQSVSLVSSPYVTFSAEDMSSMNTYGYSLKVPKVLETIDYTLLTDHEVQSSIQKGTRDRRVKSVINIRYYVQNEDVHVLHDDVASIEIIKLTDWNEMSKEAEPGILLTHNKDWAFIAKIPSESILPLGTLDHTDYTAYAQIIKNHGYYLSLITK